MKRSLLHLATLLLITLAARPAAAQTTSPPYLLLLVADTSIITGIDTTLGQQKPVFRERGMNALLASARITAFHRVAPHSRFDWLRQVFEVRTDSLDIGRQLQEAFPDDFPVYEIMPETRLFEYYPNDWHLSMWGPYYSDGYLEYINAPIAWDEADNGTHGDPNIVVGISDLGYDWEHPELNGKIDFLDYPVKTAHGTFVAGLVAGKTDNDIGYPSIGFNTKVHLTGWNSYGILHELSLLHNRPVINASWGGGGTPNLSLGSILGKVIIDEIYENGSFLCAAAGNGPYMDSPSPASYYVYPASMDHVFSVSSVGWYEDPADSFNVWDVHAHKLGDTVNTFQHNSRVDLLAPGINIGGLNYNATDPAALYTIASGTSFSSPLVAGTAALMLANSGCLSPYQLEYLLKTTARRDPVLLNPYNLPFAGRLGAGALDAGAAVVGSHYGNFSCNDAATQTFHIKGIDINSVCAPGHAANGVKPKLIPILENGTPPYRYVWQSFAEIGGAYNNSKLDAYSIATPTIDSSWGSHLAFYRLTIYDSSPVEKVASRTIKIQLKTDTTYDLALRDSWLDMLDEPNTQENVDPREWNIWESPDLWNRNLKDGGTEPEDPIYYSNVADSNYMYARIRNVGCGNYTGGMRVSLYWTKASTGEHWKTDWTSAFVSGVGGGLVPAGGRITGTVPIPIPALQPGEYHIVNHAWKSPQPELYDTSVHVVDVCGLARIHGLLENSGMTFTEVTETSVNVRNNNNIVTRNMILSNLGNKQPYQQTDRHQVYIGNTSGQAQTYTLELTTDKDIFRHFAGNLSEYVTIEAKLDPALFARWWNAGHTGSYAAANQQTSTITYDPSTPMRLENITLAGGEKFSVILSFKLRPNVAISGPASQLVHFRQLIDREPVSGNVSFRVNVFPDENGPKNRPSAIPAIQEQPAHYQLFPNPASNKVFVRYTGSAETTIRIRLTDLSGRVLLERTTPVSAGMKYPLDISLLSPGVYFITTGNDQEQRTFKLTKTK